MPIGLGDIVGQIGTGVYRLIKGKDVNIKAGSNVTPSADITTLSNGEKGPERRISV